MGWPVVTLGKVCEVIAGQSPESKFYNQDGNGIPFYQGKKDFGDKYIGKPSNWTKKLTKQANAGDILMSVRAPVGPINFSTQDCCIGRGLAAIRPLELIDRNFLFYTLLFKQDEIKGSEGAVFASINKKQIEQLEISFVTLAEQKRIAAILDQAFADIEKARANTEQNLKNARELFDSYLNQVFSQRGEGWVERTLGDISDRVSVGHVGSTSKFYCEKDIGVPFIRSQNVRPYGIETSKVKYITKEFHKSLKKSQLQIGDLLFVRVGANRGDCCALRDFEGELNCANIVFARPRGSSIDYLEHFCNSKFGQDSLLDMTTGSAQGVINTRSVAQLRVPLPPLEQQLVISEKANRIKIESQHLEIIYRNKVQNLDELKKSLLQKAFSGELTKSEGMVA